MIFETTDIMRRTFLWIVALVLSAQMSWAIDQTYYSSLEGKKDANLRQALTVLLYTNHTKFDKYNWDFPFDYDSNGYVWDIYTRDCQMPSDIGTGNTCCCDGVNREHVVCQSTFGQGDSKDKIPQYSDRHHLFLVDAHTNSFRSNYAYGECHTSADASHGSCANSSTHIPGEGNSTCEQHSLGWLGSATTFSNLYNSNQKVYEVDDEFKGDIARAVLYMVVRYAEKTYCRLPDGARYCTSTLGTGTTVNTSLTTENNYPVTAWINSQTENEVGQMFSTSLSPNYGLSDYGKAILLKWHRQDPVSQKEKDRNDGVEAVQGNRNPFVDQPNLVEYLWGNKTGQSFTLDDSGETEETFTVTWMANGSQHTQNNTISNTTATLPHTYPADCDEPRVFVGWTSQRTVSQHPQDLFSAYTPIITKDTTFYAVYADTTLQSGGEAVIGFTQDDFEGQGRITYGDSVSATIDNITVACNRAYGDAVALRCYSGSTLTISSSNSIISSIEFTFSGDYTGGLNTSYTGLSTNEWSMSLTSQARFTSIAVTDNSGYTILYSNYSTYCNVPTYMVTFMDKGKEYAVRQRHEGETITDVENPATCQDYAFYGWSTSSYNTATTTPPTVYASNALPAITADATYYAVYSYDQTTPSVESNEYALYSGVLTEGDYVIYYTGSALKAAISSSRFNCDTIVPTNNSISEPHANLVWHIAPNGNYWTIYNNSVSKYAGGTNSKNQGALLAEVTDWALWSCNSTINSETYEFENKGRASASSDSERKFLRNNKNKTTNYGFACYANDIGGALSLYKKGLPQDLSVTYYTTSPDCPNTPTTIEEKEVKVSAQKVLIGGKLFIRRDGHLYDARGQRVK